MCLKYNSFIQIRNKYKKNDEQEKSSTKTCTSGALFYLDLSNAEYMQRNIFYRLTEKYFKLNANIKNKITLRKYIL